MDRYVKRSKVPPVSPAKSSFPYSGPTHKNHNYKISGARNGEPPAKKIKIEDDNGNGNWNGNWKKKQGGVVSAPHLPAPIPAPAPGPTPAVVDGKDKDDGGGDVKKEDNDNDDTPHWVSAYWNYELAGVADNEKDSPTSALAPVKTDEAAIKEYETLRASQEGGHGTGTDTGKDANDNNNNDNDNEDGAASRLEKRNWVRGRNSIYVDAFNLALDTVLKDESDLFDGREKQVFEQWRGLSYEAQYLYVRLFLRKTASWHRVERLGSYTEIASPELAVSSLLETRHLPRLEAERSREAGIMPEMDRWPLSNPFAFADSSDTAITTVAEAAALLSLAELRALAKMMRVTGKNKEELVEALCRASAQQPDLLSLGLHRRSSAGESSSSSAAAADGGSTGGHQAREGQGRDSTRSTRLLVNILGMTGPLIRLSEPVFRLFERVHLVFYRSPEWTEKSLITIILAKTARRNYPSYVVCRSLNIFQLRRNLLEFEHSIRREFDVDQILEFGGYPDEGALNRVLDIFRAVAPRWRELLRDEQRKEEVVYASGEGAYLRRFNAAHPYTRIAHKAAHVLGRLHRFRDEYALLAELLDQRLFHPARRGSWYQRKALLEQHYMWKYAPAAEEPDAGTTATAAAAAGGDAGILKRDWLRAAAETCETALRDRDCHVIYHYDLQKRLVRLEKILKIPRRLQHDFGHVKLREPEIDTVRGVQLVHNDSSEQVARPGGNSNGNPGTRPSTKTIWLDREGSDPQARVGVEAMCLSNYRLRGWKGYHAEGGILRTLFAYLFYDVLFAYVPNVFQTAFQSCPLDLHTDAFYAARASLVNHRLAEIANGGGPQILRAVDAAHRERRTCVAGLNWDYDVADLLELVSCFPGEALATVCRAMAQDYKGCGGGVPDLVLWRTPATAAAATQGKKKISHKKQNSFDTASPSKKKKKDGGSGGGPGTPGFSTKYRGESDTASEVMFVEVKSITDRLSDAQRLWIHMLAAAGVRVTQCNAVAVEVRSI